MNERKSDVIARIKAYGIIKDPHWLDSPDELVPMWVMLEALLELIDRFNPPHQPYD